jgi:NDP-sugar pyrophosphorylase family protein
VIVVIPMAGAGARLRDEFDVPKPFVPIAGRPMLSWAFQSVAQLPYTRVVFVALAAHSRIHGLPALADSLAPGRASVVEIDAVTDGQLCTVLAARSFLDTDEDLLIASADTYVVSELARDIATRPAECRGLLSVARVEGDNWSFAAVDETGRVVRVAEKERISPLASTGLYYFAGAREFTAAADALIAAGRRTRGEFYVAPLYQDYIDSGRMIGVSEASAIWDMGSPAALRRFEELVAGRAPA